LVKYCDFAVSERMNFKRVKVRSKTCSPTYMSPEALLKAKSYDPFASGKDKLTSLIILLIDVWSVGVVFAEMLLLNYLFTSSIAISPIDILD
jgi:serine/threonine protein kinase